MSVHKMVTDISLVGRWDARGESKDADVMMYAKVQPQPSSKVAMLHMGPLVIQSTLVRVVPLLPDGTSPWESPGVEALNIATVSGRHSQKLGRQRTPGLPQSKKARHSISTDGTCGNTSDDGSAGGSISPPQPPPLPTPYYRGHTGVNGGNLEATSPFVKLHGGGNWVDPDSLHNYDSPSEFGSRLSSGSCTDNTEASEPIPFLGPEGLDLLLSSSLGEDGVQDDTKENLTPSVSVGHSWLPNTPAISESPDLGISPLEMTGKKCVSYSRDSAGVLERVLVDICDLERINVSSSKLQKAGTTKRRLSSLTYPPRVESGRIFSTGSYPSLRGVPPLPGNLVEDLKRGDLGTLDPEAKSVHGHDGAGELKEVYKGKLRGVKQALFSEVQQDNPQLSGDRHITISMEDDVLFLCFPKNIRSDSVVVEVLLRIRRAAFPQNKDCYAFMLSGLPLCEKPAFFDFKVIADEEWVFDVEDHEQAAVFESLQLDEPNRFRGQLYLSDQNSELRSVLIRVQHVPSHAEIHSYKIRSKTNALFSWTPDGKVAAEFEIEVNFIDVKVVETVARNLVNLILINGIGDTEDVCITAGSGEREKFSMEGPVMKDGRELHSASLLQVSRLVRDVRDSMTISFRKVKKSTPCFFHIPLVELGRDADLLEQTAIIHEPQLPLNISFTPDLSFWRDLNEEKDLPGSRKITRIVDNPTIEYPRVLVGSLMPVSSTAINVLSKYKHLKYIDKMTYEIEEHSSSLWMPPNPMTLHLIMTFEICGPTEDGTELLRMFSGHFEAEFVTINGVPAKMIFMDDSDLVVLNYGQVYCNDEPISFSVFWKESRSHKITTIDAGQVLEFQLPRVNESLVGRTICEYPNWRGGPRIISRTKTLETGGWTVPFSQGKAALSGIQSFRTRLYLQFPLHSHQAPQKVLPKSEAVSIEDSGETTDELLFEHPVCDTASSLDGPPPVLPDIGSASPFAFDGAFSAPSTIGTFSVDFEVFSPPEPVETEKTSSIKSLTSSNRRGRSWLLAILLLTLPALFAVGFFQPWDHLQETTREIAIRTPFGHEEEGTSIYGQIERALMGEQGDVLHKQKKKETGVCVQTPSPEHIGEGGYQWVENGGSTNWDEGKIDWEEEVEGRVTLFRDGWSLLYYFIDALGRWFF